MTNAVTVNVKGTTIKLGDGNTPTETFSTIGQITDWDGFDETAKAIDVTVITDDYVMRDGGGQIDSGKLSLDILYDPANTTFGSLQSGLNTRKNFQIVLSNGTTQFAFAAVIAGIKKMAKKGDKLRAQVSLEISGAITKSTIGG